MKYEKNETDEKNIKICFIDKELILAECISHARVNIVLLLSWNLLTECYLIIRVPERQK